MPRSSRSHKSRRTMPSSSSRGARNRHESEEEFEEESRKRKPAVKERAAASSGVRFSKPSPKGQSALQDDVEKSSATDRWDGGDKSENFGPLEAEKAPKSSLLVVVAEKRRPEKDLRRESQNRDGKVEDSRRERSDDATSRKQGVEKGRYEKEPGRKDSTEWQGQDVLRCPERQKELEKHSRRGGSSSKTVNYQEDGRNGDDKRLSSRDDRWKDPRYKDEMHKVERRKDERHRDKSREEHDRNVRQRDERSSRDFSSSRSDSKRPRDEKKLSEGHSKKSKLQGNLDGNLCIKDCGNKSKDAIGQKSYICENDAHGAREHGNVKEPHKDVEEMLSNTNKVEFPHPDKFDSSLSNNRSKSFASSSSHTARDQCRASSKQAESAYSLLGYEDGFHLNATSAGDGAGVSASHESVCEPLSSENKANDIINCEELLMEAAEAALQNDKISRSDGHVSPIQLAEKSPSTASDQRCSSRSGARHNVDMQYVEQEGCGSKDGKECYSVDDQLELPLKSASVDDSHSQIDAQSSEIAPTASSSYNQEGPLSGNSPGHLPSPLPVKLGTDSSSVLDSCEVDRVRLGNRKSNRRYKRNSDIIVERGRGNSWTGSHTWPSPVPSGFIPFPNAPPPPGFHSTIQQFPASAPFGMRPSMDMNHMGVPYHTHGMDDHFSSHDWSFGGWCNLADDSFPRMQGWDGGNNAHVYQGPDWDRNGHLMGSLGWGMNPSVWNKQSGSIDIEFPIPQESEYSSRSVAGGAQIGQLSNQSCSERVHSDHVTDESTEMKQSSWSPAKNVAETRRRSISERASGHYEISNTNTPPFCHNYLSKLEISLDLTTSELYEQCMTLLASKPLGVCRVYNQGNTNSQNSKKEFNLAVKGQKLKYLFPSITDAMFQRAMSLYKEQANMKEKIAVSTSCSEGICTQEDPDIEKMESVSSQISEGPSPAGADSVGNMKDVMDIITDAAGDISSYTREQLSNMPSDVRFVCSKACEQLIPECRVNLNRIHNSPGSTY